MYEHSEKAAVHAPTWIRLPELEFDRTESQYREEAVSQRAVRSERLVHVSSCSDDDNRDEQVHIRDEGTLDHCEPHGSGSNFSWDGASSSPGGDACSDELMKSVQTI